MEEMETEILIVGGGVLGAAVARELSRYQVDVMLVEKEATLVGVAPRPICVSSVREGIPWSFAQNITAASSFGTACL